MTPSSTPADNSTSGATAGTGATAGIASTPAGYTTLAPWVVTEETAALLAFVTTVFDGEELARIETEDGLIGHAEIRVGDTVLLAFDRRPDWPAMPSLLRIFVADADKAFARAVESGARIVTELSTAAWGDRGGRIRDPWGNIWWVVSHVEDVPAEEVGARMSDPQYAEAMQVAQATFDAEMTGAATGRSSRPVL
ncbi:VOC family protein [Kribbella endophytica]